MILQILYRLWLQYPASEKLPIGSNPEDIRRAFRRKSLENHPDRNRGDGNAESRMAEILHVNSILTDPQKKEVYDQFGSKVRGEHCFNHV